MTKWTYELMCERMRDELTMGSVFAELTGETQHEIAKLTESEVADAAHRVMTRPMPGEVAQSARLLLNPCLTVQWLQTFEDLDLPRDLKVYEPCAGASDPVLMATEIYTAGTGEYTTLNLNRILAGQLKEKIVKVKMPVVIVEEDASGEHKPLPNATVDVACFHHAINDILQTAVSEPRDMDTRAIEWWSNERQMIEWLDKDYREGNLSDRARPALLGAIQNAIDMVRPGGYLIFDHWTWVGHQKLEWFPWELYNDLIPMARRWILEEDMPITERELPGRDSRWWMIWQKD